MQKLAGPIVRLSRFKELPLQTATTIGLDIAKFSKSTELMPQAK